MTTMKELIDAVAKRSGETKARTGLIIEAMFTEMREKLAWGQEVRIQDFAVFEVANRAARTGRNPQTGEPIAVPARRVVKMRMATVLREALNPQPKPRARRRA